MGNDSVITIERAGHVAIVWLDRPEARNAIGQQFFDDLQNVVQQVGEDPEVRVCVLAARGPDFSVGLDLKNPGPAVIDTSSGAASNGGQSRASRAAFVYAHCKKHQAAFSAVAECPKPWIAAVHGFCVGGGLDLIAACDIRVAAADARFSVRETKIAVVADMGTLQRLPGIIGRGNLAELALTGKIIDANRALDMGLIASVHADAGAALAAAREIADEIALNSPLSVQGTKAVIAASEDRFMAQNLDYLALWQGAMLDSHDLREAVIAFREKRPPRFTGS